MAALSPGCGMRESQPQRWAERGLFYRPGPGGAEDWRASSAGAFCVEDRGAGRRCGVGPIPAAQDGGLGP
eukprot:8002776-Pyramimonas_sp.AAC.1